MRAFRHCCDVAPDALDAALAEACGEDARIRARVLQLLAADALAATSDTTFVAGRGRALIVADFAAGIAMGDDDVLPEALGPYRVVGLLGAGGMGLVYEAEQARPKRRVALKTVHPRLQSEVMLAHFRHEVEVMGALTHPTIPQVFEAGEHAGIAWLAMELVRGQPLGVYAEGKPVDDKLRLLIEVLDGVAHAHAAGVVHCDLKPDNILVTIEGQPKVLDFGLALSSPDEGAALQRAGIAGTLAYMAPEQRVRGAVLDARVDVFALGVVLRELVTDVSDDLAAVIAKATATDPAGRYPDARELAADLRRYLALRPVAARPATWVHRVDLWGARHRSLVRAGLMAVLGLALIGLGAIVWQAIANARVESRARMRMATVERRVAELEAVGDTAQADAVFHLYAGMHDHLGTHALYDAWVWRARRSAAAVAIEAWAEAVTNAVTRADEVAALMELANAFVTAGDWRSLDHVLARLDDAPGTGDLRFRTAVFHRELAAAATIGQHATLPIVAALAPAMRVTEGLDLVQPFRWQGRDLLFVRDDVEHTVRVLDPQAGFAAIGEPPVRPVRTTLGLPRALTGAEGWLIELSPDGTRGPVAQGDVAGPIQLVRFDGSERVTLTTPYPYRAVGWVGDDGVRAVLGSAGRARDVLSVVVRDGDATLLQAPPMVRAPASDADALLRADLDGDGVPEVVVALGAWGAYDLRVFHVDDAGAFTPLARRRVGMLEALTLLPRSRGPGAGRPLIAATKVDRYPSVARFGRAAPFGPPAGVYLFAYAGGAIEEVGFVALPGGIGRAQILPNLVAGDFDGDGLVDLALDVKTSRDSTMVVLRQMPSGDRPVFEQILVHGVQPLLALQVDDDPASELLVRLAGDTARHGWVMGAGTDVLPLLPRGPTEGMRQREDVATSDAAFARVWQGARTLSELGLLRRAAENLEAAALLAESDAVETAVVSEAAALRLELGEAERAANLYERASERAAVGSSAHAVALVGAARSWLAAIDAPRALARYRELAVRPEPAYAPFVEEARSNVARLESHVATSVPTLVLTWDGPLSAPLEVVAPESISRSARGGGIDVRAFSDQDAIARVPVRYEGGRVAIDVEVTLSRLEIGGGLEVELRPAAARTDVAAKTMFGVSTYGSGGDESISVYSICQAADATPGAEFERPIAAAPERVRMRIDYWPASAGIGSRLSCRIWRDGVQVATFPDLPRDVAFAPGDYDVVLAGPALRDWTAVSELRASLERISVDGVTVRPSVPETPLARAHRAYVNGDFAAALAAYRELPGADAYALMAELELADDAALGARMATLLAGWRGDATLRHLLRTQRARVVPLLQRLDPAGFAQTFNAVWDVALRYTEVPEIRAALLEPTLDRLAGTNVDELSLLIARAKLLYRRGELERSAAIVTRALAADVIADPERQGLIANVALLAARIAHRRGDVGAARTYVERWRSSLPLIDLAKERLEVDPEDAVLLQYL